MPLPDNGIGNTPCDGLRATARTLVLPGQNVIQSEDNRRKPDRLIKSFFPVGTNKRQAQVDQAVFGGFDGRMLSPRGIEARMMLLHAVFCNEPPALSQRSQFQPAFQRCHAGVVQLAMEYPPRTTCVRAVSVVRWPSAAAGSQSCSERLGSWNGHSRGAWRIPRPRARPAMAVALTATRKGRRRKQRRTCGSSRGPYHSEQKPDAYSYDGSRFCGAISCCGPSSCPAAGFPAW